MTSNYLHILGPLMLLLYINVTISAKCTLFAPKLNSVLLAQCTDTLIIYPSPVYQVFFNVNCMVCFSEGHFAHPPKSSLKQWHHGGC